ncbi:carboxypeptidase M32 [Butyrivibrio sp. INlla16]|uniref:carboxypeptidase M32 n=1 Tax=Butyrivibrio sp. INlla16 TaxID=1520807 RepID=UPI000888C43F|nr:carboxypeptidase M32 [Butyrivibrio sp. INlla16]SDB30166.1 carboxypeptidase Taq [Butyrivibrio sp. INlla16]
MTKETQEKLNYILKASKEIETYNHACRILSYDQETICPVKGMETQGEVSAFLSNQAFKIAKDAKFTEAAEYLYEHKDELNEWDTVLADQLHRAYIKEKNITPEKNMEISLVYNKAFVDWSKAREASDFSMFRESFKNVFEMNKEIIKLRDINAGGSVYNQLLDDYERDITTDVLDECFGKCKERLLPLLDKIKNSKKNIRRDFLEIEVTDEQQAKIAKWLLETIDFDLERGAFTTSEHPFTNGLGKDDVRVTTHYYPNYFIGSMYSIIHEGGHALFEMLVPEENHEHFINDGKTMGMHESVSRLYENRIGRSKEFVSLIYPKVCEVFPQVMKDVSENELYEALNIVEPSLIRTEADELTYTFHVIIRYEIEKALFEGTLVIDDVPKVWNEKYKGYLGIEPENDREGVLQDVHWTFGFGYFPAYAIGNMYNAMYFNRMKNEIDISNLVAKGDFRTLNNWMAENVFKKADRLSPSEWIKEITGRTLTADDFLDYLEEKYTELYNL